MARPTSVALGGFFATPQHLIPLIAQHLAVGANGSAMHYADPCAGEGAAIYGLFEALGGYGSVFTCELESQRHAVLLARTKDSGWNAGQRTLHGDAFNLELSKGIGLLFLNPPYDTDPVHGRLEQRYLDRFSTGLCDGGVLVFVVPFYALAASAETLALTFDDVECYRFPKDDFASFKQVVVFASKVKARLSPDALIEARVKAWAKSVARCPLLGSKKDTHEIPGSPDWPSWRLREFDLKGLVAKARPWRESRVKGTGNLTAVPHILPEVPVEDLLFRTFQVATAPRPAHIAAGIASGLFNGREVSSTTPGLPNLLVKGVFTREYVTIQENVNKDGDVTSVTQVQQPKLETTVLNLETKQYSRLAPVGSPKTAGVDGMGIEGLLEHYGESLMHVMARQCPVTYDPKRDAESLQLAPVGRPLYRAHVNAAQALYMLLGGPGLSRSQRKGKAAILLGEIGSGKTATVLALANTIGKRILVVCPPHLLDSWQNETRTVLPNADIVILDDISDLDALVQLPSDRTLVAILSREDAKLGHGMAGVQSLGCPKCGATLPSGDLAKKRVHCLATPLTLHDDLARAAFSIAYCVAPQAPANGNVRALLEGRHLGSYLERLANAPKKGRAPWAGFDADWVLTTLATVTRRLANGYDERLCPLLGELLMADYDPERIAALARTFSGDKLDYRLQSLGRALTCLLPIGSELQNEVQQETYGNSRNYYCRPFAEDIATLRGAGLTNTAVGPIKLDGGQLLIDGNAPQSAELAVSILAHLVTAGHITRAEQECGEPLFQAVPLPRRYPVAKYIVRRHPNLFDFLLLDEAHEFRQGDSAQSQAAHRLTGLGIPFVLMTGSLMNGYADSLFTNMWAVSADFRAEFKRDEKQKFCERNGYHKRVLTDKDRDTKEIVAFGSQTDRVERAAKTTGKAPGILPLFLFRHLLAHCVTLHKADLALDLPKCTHFKHQITPSPKQLAGYKALLGALKTQITKDRFSTEGLSGKLFGALAELPSYLDRATADVGNQDDGTYAIQYPQNVGGAVVASAEPLSAKALLPKEQWMIDTVRSELAEGRKVMVFCWHVNLLPRLARLLKKELGIRVAVLHADKVPPSKREAWINKNVRDAAADVLLANPVGIQTGLNNLVYFATEVWMENPATDPTIFRQAVGRIDRVAQKLETRIHVPIYTGTMQEQLHDLLLRKVAVATSTDGLDSESMLLAAGAGEDAMLTGLSIGRQLWNMLMDVN